MSLFDPGLWEAAIFVFEKYAKKQKLGQPNPPLLPVFKAVTKHFNAYGNPSAQFGVDELIRYYIGDKLADFNYKPTPFGREMFLAGYGLETLPGTVSTVLKEWVQTGDTSAALARIQAPAGGKPRPGAVDKLAHEVDSMLKG
jgi:hypothetical protein